VTTIKALIARFQLSFIIFFVLLNEIQSNLRLHKWGLHNPKCNIESSKDWVKKKNEIEKKGGPKQYVTRIRLRDTFNVTFASSVDGMSVGDTLTWNGGGGGGAPTVRRII